MRNINVTSKGVEKMVNNVNVTKAIGPDGIHSCVLKEMSKELSDILAHLFQQFINRSTISDEYLPSLEKKPDTCISIPSNYGPVSLTCITCKLLEHIICSNLMQHFKDQNIPNNIQHAFRKYHSCETQLVSVIHDWETSIENWKQTDIFILEFEKAFSTVPHELLKCKLSRYGVRRKNIKLERLDLNTEYAMRGVNGCN
ncbi:unnamed protein product [Mytilus coruscus]|uniref:Uncharacterized protein n=1 Tax=Mytilus coruscus TaxID=42192 RepID=A0A6J8DID4_MYTCO|nr:unnamed protein product [Mytilus coruscus]